ncbi:hypothetical protein HK405_010404 [Cladochytrium tenue]|nr:hypothetical protein HK405_010404 [Cladochytrium tenue]
MRHRSALPLVAVALLAAAHAIVASPVPQTTVSVATTSTETCDGCTNTGNTADPLPVYSSDPHVTVKNGSYAGVYLAGVDASATASGIPVKHAQDLFLGMPYAQSPAPRFQRANSLNSTWSDTLPAKRYGYQCFGVGGDDNYSPPYIKYAMSEDCHTVNVVRPHGTSKDAGLPVVAWIHGGGFQVGGSADIRYNGSWIVDRSVDAGHPVIFTSFNYRKGRLGFPQGDAATSEGILNLGLYDQRLALQWLHENIAAFGGDPKKVTIMGESAGGASIFLQLTAFGGRDDGLFRGAIAESGYWGTTIQTDAVKSTLQTGWDYLMSAAGCTQGGSAAIACARQASWDTIVAAIRDSAANGTGSFNPVVDGDFVQQDLQMAFRAGKFAPVSTLFTANSDEGTAFGTYGVANETQLLAVVSDSLPAGTYTDAVGEALLSAYPNDPGLGCPYSAGDGLLSTGAMDRRSLAIGGDFVMVGPRREASRLMSGVTRTATGRKANVYAGRFDQLAAGLPITVGATHFQEVAYVFRNPVASQNPLGTNSRDLALSEVMNAYWVSFIATQDPSTLRISGSPKWPEYGSSGKTILSLTNKASGVSTFQEKDTWREDGIQTLMDARASYFD